MPMGVDNEPQCEKMYLLKCAPNEEESASTSVQSDQGLQYLQEKKLHPSLSKMPPVKVLIRQHECAG